MVFISRVNFVARPAFVMGASALLLTRCAGGSETDSYLSDGAEPTTPVEDVVEIETVQPTYEDPETLTIYPNGTAMLSTWVGDEKKYTTEQYSLSCLGAIDGDLLMTTYWAGYEKGGMSSLLIQGHPACADGKITQDDGPYFE